jgi:hypothetical protein
MSRRIQLASVAGLASLVLTAVAVGGAQPLSAPKPESNEAKLAALEKQIRGKEQELAALRTQAASLRGKTGAPAAAGPEEDAARVLIRHAKARIDGVDPPAFWPEKVRRAGSAWVADIDTTRLPGGYPEQILVEVSGAGGHSAGRTQKPAAAPEPKDRDDFRWLLNSANGRDGLDRFYMAMLEKLEKSKVPTARKAKSVAIEHKLNSGGLDAREGVKVVGLLRIDITVPDFADSGDLIWVVRFSILGSGVSQEMWISSTTGAIRTMLPLQKQPK